MKKANAPDLACPIEGNEKEAQRLAWELWSGCGSGWM